MKRLTKEQRAMLAKLRKRKEAIEQGQRGFWQDPEAELADLERRIQELTTTRSQARRAKAVMHFNKPGSYRGLPWSVHWRGKCHMGHEVRCMPPMKSEWKPEKKTSPRAFFTAMAAEVKVIDGVIYLT